MFEYELHRINQAELIARADAERLAGQFRKARRAQRRSAKHEAEGRVSRSPSAFTRAA
ncbi:hypothetical protein [Streptomyces purpureus]|uniref:Uncharacterized protein n=1 Tax=Streptomyces purpureus TaxID=1951 RepID=A0A918HBU4_9ACTN|nr:hypothetical protein [Streptomyces purpureus]GGT49263.1 hypothetical protein GCM10014713_49410 [Streptomyces purpureus]